MDLEQPLIMLAIWFSIMVVLMKGRSWKKGWFSSLVAAFVLVMLFALIISGKLVIRYEFLYLYHIKNAPKNYNVYLFFKKHLRMSILYIHCVLNLYINI